MPRSRRWPRWPRPSRAPAVGPAPAVAPAAPVAADVAANGAPPAPVAAEPTAAAEDAARKPKRLEPAVHVAAAPGLDQLLRTPDGKTELAEARLRGAVEVHQDPAPDKPRGTHARQGEALDLRSVGPGLMKLNISETDPEALADSPRLAARDGVRIAPRALAAIDTDEYAIRGPVVGLDQSTDFAWVNGPGSLTQRADRGFLNDKGLQKRAQELARLTPEERAKEQSKKVPLTISWTEQMRFYGQSRDPKGRPSAKAEFRGEARARSETYAVSGDEIDTFTDRPVHLVSRKPPAAKPPAGANPDDVPPTAAAEEPKAELVLLEARSRKPWQAGKRGVGVVNVRRDEATGQRIERQEIECGTIRYDKRTGDYHVPGPGIVRLYRRSAIKPDPKKPTAEKLYGPWELTKVAFAEEMLGRFGVASDKSDEQPEPRTADFYGNVATVNGPVRDDTAGDSDIDFDNRPAGSRYMTSDRLRIVDYPPPKGVKDVAAYQIITADGGNVQAHDDTSNIAADYLHYDTQKGLFYAYGEDGRKITITRQPMVGQEETITRAEAFIYNIKTKALQEINPFQILLYDGKAARLGPAPAPVAPGPAAKPRPVRQPLRPPPRMNTERRDFNSR